MLYPGLKVTIDNVELTIPPLSLGQLRGGALQKMREHDELVGEGKHWEAAIVRGEIIYMALTRNHPDFPEDKFLAHVDLASNTSMWLAVLGASGFNVGEGEAATANRVNGISVPSIEASPLLTDGPTKQ